MDADGESDEESDSELEAVVLRDAETEAVSDSESEGDLVRDSLSEIVGTCVSVDDSVAENDCESVFESDGVVEVETLLDWLCVSDVLADSDALPDAVLE